MTDCTWNSPGADPFRGASPAQAIAAYGFPQSAQVELLRKLRRIEPDASVTITRDGLISGTGDAFDLRDMHYGNGRMCSGPVARDAWAPDARQDALVYCSGFYCIAVPMVCGNISRITFVRWPPAAPVVIEPPTVTPRGPGTPPWVPRGGAHMVVHEVPEPGTWALVALGIGVMAATKRRAV